MSTIYLDVICLVTGHSHHEHLQNLEVLKHLEETGMELKEEKCVFLMSDVEYLGHRINRECLQPTESQGVCSGPEPRRVAEFRLLLG